MCLTIPKKVIEIGDNFVVTEDHNGSRQQMKTLIELAVGDFCMSQQNVVIEKIPRQEAEEIFNMIRRGIDI